VKREEVDGADTKGVLSSFSALSYDAQVEVVSTLLGEVAREKKVRAAELLSEVMIPFGIFTQKKLSSLEAIVKFLKEVRGMKLASIAKLLGRDSSTVWATYSKANEKMNEPFVSIRDEVMMPASLLADRNLSVLTHIVLFGKKIGYSNHEIAVMLSLDDRTVWSVLNRAKSKRGAL
jgi:predicted DNA-binding protein (UPF0251 family)